MTNKCHKAYGMHTVSAKFLPINHLFDVTNEIFFRRIYSNLNAARTFVLVNVFLGKVGFFERFDRQ